MGKYGIGKRVRSIHTGCEAVIVGKCESKGGRMVRYGDGSVGPTRKCHIESIPLKIDAGRYYRTRDGQKVGPMEESGVTDFPWEAEGYVEYCRNDGSVAMHDPADPQDLDLVAEWIEPEQEPDQASEAEPQPARHVAIEFEIQPAVEEAAARFVDRWNRAFTCTSRPEKHIVCLLSRKGNPLPADRPRVHNNLEDAEKEAQRLADKTGRQYAVFSQGAIKELDVGPLPRLFDIVLAEEWMRNRRHGSNSFLWTSTAQGFNFWHNQAVTGLTPTGRTILAKWIKMAKRKQHADRTAAKAA